MKNTVKMIGIIVIIGLLMTACGDGDTHTCSFENWTETTPPTCIVKGIETGTCSCGATSTRTVDEDPDAHDWGNYVGTEPTCLADGEGTATCNLCDVEDEIAKQKLGHSFTDYTSNENATCLEDGTETAICDRCDTEDEKNEENTALGHNLITSGEVTKVATCTEDGIGKLDCTRCDYSEPSGVIQKLGHSFNDWSETRAATCTVENQKTRTCILDCDETGHTETQSTIPAKGHTWSVWGNSTATCTVAGIETRTCTLACGLTGHTENRSAAALGHSFTTWSETRAATCTVENQETRTCTRYCGLVGHTQTQSSISAKGHTFIDNWINSTATCTVTGTETRTCTFACGLTGHTESRPAVALGHQIINWSSYNTTTGHVSCNRVGCTGGFAKLGDTGPAGGIIFYAATEGFTMTDNGTKAYYLEAAPANMETLLRWSTITQQDLQESGWDNSIFIDIHGTETAIGTGRKNTMLILELDSTAPSALACKNYFVTGYEIFTDWFLPSRDELNAMYIAMAEPNNVVGLPTSGWLASSSQVDNYQIWDQNFVGGHQVRSNKSFLDDVRAVRAF